MVRILAGATALIGWTALVLQLGILVDNMGPFPALWRFIGFFTLLTNVGVAGVSTAIALGKGRMARPRARLLAATSIAIVGIVYSIALRGAWDPKGLQKVADVALHDAMPIMFVLLWFIAPHPRLAWKEAAWALVPPALYAVYAVARGALDGWYAYWFLDPTTRSPVEMLVALGTILGAAAVIAVILVAFDRWLGQEQAEQIKSD